MVLFINLSYLEKSKFLYNLKTVQFLQIIGQRTSILTTRENICVHSSLANLCLGLTTGTARSTLDTSHMPILYFNFLILFNINLV